MQVIPSKARDQPLGVDEARGATAGRSCQMTFFSGNISCQSGELVRIRLPGTGMICIDRPFDLGNQTELCQQHWGSAPECYCSVNACDLPRHSEQCRCCCSQRCPSWQHDCVRGNIYVAPPFRRGAFECAVTVPAHPLPHGDTPEDCEDFY